MQKRTKTQFIKYITYSNEINRNPTRFTGTLNIKYVKALTVTEVGL